MWFVAVKVHLKWHCSSYRMFYIHVHVVPKQEIKSILNATVIDHRLITNITVYAIRVYVCCYTQPSTICILPNQ